MIALLRLGRREAWRHKARSLLVVVLILIPVALSAGVLVIVPAWSGNPEAHTDAYFGEAQALVTDRFGSASGLDTQWGNPARRGPGRVIEGATFKAWVPTGPDGVVDSIDTEQVDATDPIVAPKYAIAAGRAPERAGEVALSRHALEQFGLEIDDTLRLAMPDVAVTVVGELDDFGCTDCDRAVLAPGSVPRPSPPTDDDPLPAEWTSMAWADRWYLQGFPQEMIDTLTLGPPSASIEDPALGPAADLLEGVLIEDRRGVHGSETDPTEGRAWTIAGAAFLLLWTGLVAASGLAVGARRRKRELGLLAANGADPAALRLAVVAEGLVLGVVGSTIGVALGTAVAAALHPRIAESTFLGAPLTIPYSWLVIAWAVGTLAAVVAAWSASVGVASLTPSQLLRGHRPTPRPAPAWFAAGAGLFVGGCIVLRVGREANSDAYGTTSLDQVVVAAGVLLVTLGVVAVVVGATRIAGRITGSASTSVRLAGRDLARHGVRIAAATAAVALTLTGAITFASYDRANRPPPYEHPLYQEYERGDPMTHGGPESIGVLRTERSRLIDGRVLPLVADDGTLAVLTERVPVVGTLRRHMSGDAVRQCYVTGTPGSVPGPVAPPMDQCEPVEVLVADDGMLELLPPRVAEALRTGDIITNSAPLRGRSGAELPAQQVWIGLWTEEGGSSGMLNGLHVLVSEATAQMLGVGPVHPLGTEVYLGLDGAAPATAELDDIVEPLGFELEVASWQQPMSSNSDRWSPTTVFALVAAGVALVTLLIVMITLALVRVESRSDDDVLLIAGASPGLSRRVSAARAGLIVLVAALPASIGGWWVARSLMIGSAPVPWLAIALALVALPLIAASLGWLFHRPPRRLRLQ